MKYGYCLSPYFAKGDAGGQMLFNAIVKAGFDYAELRLCELATLTPEEIAKLKQALQSIPCKACYVFFPPELTLVGPEMDIEGITAYLGRMLPLAASLGAEILVFGNGNARKVPDGQCREAIWKDLRTIAEIMDAKANETGLRISIEHLNKKESNILNSYGEAVALTEGLTHVSAMIDSYHVAQDGLTYEDVYHNPKALWHLHTAFPIGRTAPSPEDDMTQYADFVQMVKKLGYNGRISVEGSLRAADAEGVEKEVRESLATLKQMFE
ncbi:MAG: sugar phosphate isomerase/epimerase [Defluviitaleaceae bacterium]|nr:sugar phosphate isomerase/epimerase [Defluviitaleaceae bacterium]